MRPFLASASRKRRLWRLPNPHPVPLRVRRLVRPRVRLEAHRRRPHPEARRRGPHPEVPRRWPRREVHRLHGHRDALGWGSAPRLALPPLRVQRPALALPLQAGVLRPRPTSRRRNLNSSRLKGRCKGSRSRRNAHNRSHSSISHLLGSTSRPLSSISRLLNSISRLLNSISRLLNSISRLLNSISRLLSSTSRLLSSTSRTTSISTSISTSTRPRLSAPRSAYPPSSIITNSSSTSSNNSNTTPCTTASSRQRPAGPP